MCVELLCVSISVGGFPVPLREVVPAIFGHGHDRIPYVVQALRLPRALTAVLVGGALGFSGAIFQSLARNPLASPDIIGISAGASASAVFVIVILSGSYAMVAGGALRSRSSRPRCLARWCYWCQTSSPGECSRRPSCRSAW